MKELIIRGKEWFKKRKEYLCSHKTPKKPRCELCGEAIERGELYFGDGHYRAHRACVLL